MQCAIKNCYKRAIIKRYCKEHYYPRKGCGCKGERNPNWRGGTSEYPNHYLMKKNRLIILIHNPFCEICKKSQATEVHHKNGDKSDHRLSNLAATCHRCNSKIRFNPNNSKYRRLYGMNLKEISNKLGRSESYWFTHREELKKNIILTND